MQVEFTYRPGRDYPWEWYYSPQGPEMITLWRWCWDTFGHPGTDPETGVYSGWDSHGGWIKFREEKDAMFFKLKWSQ